MRLGDLVGRFVSDERPDTLLLDFGTAMAQAMAAAWLVAGYAHIASLNNGLPVDAATELTASEWALIRPLFLLYVERETALQLEASRTLGVELFGRPSAAVAADIAAAEANLGHQAFANPIINL
ncbi:MAG: hypothetical protein PHU14_08065 [Methylovulum sp.]|nr:hypothetical protein [Methylovulum sp.]